MLTFPGWGLFLLVGEVGLIAAGGAKVPSKSLEYMLVNRFWPDPADLERGRANTAAVDVCLPLIALADLTLSSTISPFLRGGSDGGTGVSLALAEWTRNRLFSPVLGLSMFNSS
jgi:hypothetical protein